MTRHMLVVALLVSISLPVPAARGAGPWRPADRLAQVDSQGILRWQDTGDEVALFGVNYYTPFWHNYPDLKQIGAAHKEVIDQDVLHFARMRLDALRLHVFDREVSDADGNLMANEHLDLLDYLIARAKERGIYTVLTPIAWWPVPGDSPGFATHWTMHQMTTDPAARRPQTAYLQQFVQHVNPYTGLSYNDDPAVVCLELINEPLYPADTSDDQVVDYEGTGAYFLDRLAPGVWRLERIRMWCGSTIRTVSTASRARSRGFFGASGRWPSAWMIWAARSGCRPLTRAIRTTRPRRPVGLRCGRGCMC
mgnify:CR=1 FL=1